MGARDVRINRLYIGGAAAENLVVDENRAAAFASLTVGGVAVSVAGHTHAQANVTGLTTADTPTFAGLTLSGGAITSGAGFAINTAAGGAVALNLGGVLTIGDKDASNTARLTLDSATGALWAYGNLVLGNNATATGMDRNITLYSATQNRSMFIGHDSGIAYITAANAPLMIGCNNTADLIMYTLSTAAMRWRQSATDRMTLAVATGNLWIDGDFAQDLDAAHYFGASGTDGSWRLVRSGNNLVIERRESGAWVTKSTISA